MLAKKHWFTKRKYGGWGLRPTSWQGWAYIAFMIISLVILQSLPFLDTVGRMIVLLVWLLFFGIDTVDVMIKLERDEMEQKIEAIAERNAAWVMMGALIVGVLYQLISSGMRGELYVDPFLFAALMIGAIVKSISYYVIENRGLH